MLNLKQEEIFNGSMLGDGCISKNFSNGCICRFEKIQSKCDHIGVDKIQFMEWHRLNFDDFNASINENTRKANGLVREICGDKIFKSYVFITKYLIGWEKLETKWYIPRTDHYWFKRRKIVPQDLKLTPLTLCIWHMDDGSNSPKDANIELNTQGFTPEEIDFLIEKLNKDLGIISKRKVSRKKTGNQFKIYVGRKHYFSFIEMIKPYVEWDCFQYKLDITTYNKKPHRGESHKLSKLTEKDVRQIFALHEKGCDHKEISEIIKISKPNISMILSGNRWKHITDVVRTNKKNPRVATEVKQQIIELRKQGLFQKDIAKQLNINQSTVSRTLEKKCQELN